MYTNCLVMSKFAKSLLDRITYHTEMAGTEIAFENLKKLHPSLDSNNPFALAFLSCNPDLSEADKNILRECFKKAMEREQKLLENTIARFTIEREYDNICRHEDSMPDESISDDKKELDVSK